MASNNHTTNGFHFLLGNIEIKISMIIVSVFGKVRLKLQFYHYT